MNAKQLKTVLTKCTQNSLPVLIKGAPGMSKSDVVSQVAAELKMDLIISHPVVSDPTDFKGLPGIVNGKAEFLPFGDLRQLISAKKPTIAFLDDLGQAPASVQAAAMQLILARRVNGHRVSDKVVFVAATNRRQDRAGVTGILEPVKSRFATILELTPDLDNWTEWAWANDISPQIVGFLNFRPALLCTADATADIVNHPCPRTWMFASRLIQAGLTDMATLAGALGDGCATEFVGFMRTFDSLPSIQTILNNPDDATVPTDPAALFAVVSALTSKANEKTFGNIAKYADRMYIDFATLLVRDCVKANPKVQNTVGFNRWAAKHGGSLI
jgi:hypothetical protein